MLVLAIDTSTADLVTGLVQDSGQVVGERIISDTRRHNELLTPTIIELLAATGYTFADLGAIVAGCGPGPFTGLRVGMVTAEALAQALHIPVIGVASHDAIAQGLAEHTGLVVTDARRREVYYTAYQQGHRIAGPEVAAPAQVPVFPELSDIAGDPALVAKLPAAYQSAQVHNLGPTAAGLVAAADLSAPGGPLTPLYLRRPDAVAPPLRRSPAVPEVQL